VGVFAGCSMNTYFMRNLATGREFLEDFTGGYQVSNYVTMMGNDKDFLPTRVSYKLNLRGPSMSVQTACSTSLVAVCQAAQTLLTGGCDMALAGAVSITARPAGQFSDPARLSFCSSAWKTPSRTVTRCWPSSAALPSTTTAQ